MSEWFDFGSSTESTREPAPRRAQKPTGSTRWPLWVALGLAGIIVIAVPIALLLRGSGAVASGKANEWTHKELLDAIKAKGLDGDMFPAGKRKAYLLGMNGWDKEQSFDVMLLESIFANGNKEIAIVELCDSPAEAKDAAGVYGDKGWAFGRFAFRTNSDSKPFLAKIQKALKG